MPILTVAPKKWSEYIAELFEDDRRERPIIKGNMDGPQIIESEIRAAMKKMKRNKACGPDDINIEILEALEEFGVKTVTKRANDIYESGGISEDLCSSIFVTIPKNREQ